MIIDWSDPDGRPVGAFTTTSVLRWALAGVAVIGLHAGGIWLALNWPSPPEPEGEPAAAIMMELAPLAVAPEAVEQDVAPGPEMVEAEEQHEPEKPVEEKSSRSRSRLPLRSRPRSNRRNCPRSRPRKRCCRRRRSRPSRSPSRRRSRRPRPAPRRRRACVRSARTGWRHPRKGSPHRCRRPRGEAL